MNELTKILLRILPFIVIIFVFAIRVRKGTLSKDDLGVSKPETNLKALIWCIAFLVFCILTEYTLHQYELLKVSVLFFFFFLINFAHRKILVRSVFILKTKIAILASFSYFFYPPQKTLVLEKFKCSTFRQVFSVSSKFIERHSRQESTSEMFNFDRIK